MIILQGNTIREEPDPQERFEIVMEHPFHRPPRSSVLVTLYLGEFSIGIKAALASIRSLTETVVKAAGEINGADFFPYLDDDDSGDGAVLAAGAASARPFARNSPLEIAGTSEADLTEEGALAAIAALRNASLDVSGTFDAGLGLPPYPSPAESAAKQAREDALLSLRVQPGNTLRIAPGAITVSLS